MALDVGAQQDDAAFTDVAYDIDEPAASSDEEDLYAGLDCGKTLLCMRIGERTYDCAISQRCHPQEAVRKMLSRAALSRGSSNFR